MTVRDRVGARAPAYLGCELAYWTKGSGPPISFIQGTLASRRRAFLELVLTGAEYAGRDTDQVASELLPFFGHDLAVTPAIVMKQVRAMSKWSMLARLGELKNTPTLVVAAKEDLIARPELVRSTAAGESRLPRAHSISDGPGALP